MKAVVRLPQAAPGLRPLTLTASPAMVPLLGAPLIEPLLAHLARTGATEITLLHECFSTEVSDYFRDGRRLGALLSHIAIDPGADLAAQIAASRDSGESVGPILYFETPGWTDASADDLLSSHRAQKSSITFAGEAGQRMAVLDPSDGEQAIHWESARLLPDPPQWRPIATLDQWWDLGLSALRGEAPFITPPMPEPEPGIHTANPRSSWNQADIRGPVWIGPGTRLEAGVVIEGPTWIGSGCRIGAKVQLRRCVVENHTHLVERFELHDRYVVRNRAFCADGSTLILGDAMADHSAAADRGPASDDLVRLATRVSGLRSPVFR